MYNFGEIVSTIGKLVQRSEDTAYANNIKVWVNLSLQTLYNSYDHFIELQNVHNFTTVDGTKRYYMPSDFEKPIRFYDITNDKPIAIKTYQEYFDANIANIADATEDDAGSAYFTEVVGVKVQISTSGDTIVVDSSSTADTTQTVRIEGYLDSALTIIGFEELTLNGTTDVSGTTTFYKILNVSKSADTTGYVTLRNSSLTALTTLSDIERVSRHKAFDMGLIPGSADSMRVIYKKKFRRLVDDEDYPFIDADDYLIFDTAATAMVQEKEDINRASLMIQKAQAALSQLMLNQTTKLGPTFQHKMTSSLIQGHRA